MSTAPHHRLPIPLLVALGGTHLAFVAAVALGLAGWRLPDWMYDQLPLTISLLSAAGSWWAVWRAPAETRRAWLYFALGLSTYALGDATYNLYRHLTPRGEPPFPSWADAFYLLYAPLLTAGLWRLLRPAPGAQLRRLLLDIGTVVVTALVLLWHLVYAGAVADSENLPGLLVNLSYPLQDCGMISLVLLIAFQERVGLSRAVIGGLNLGLLVVFAADVAYATLLPEPYSLTNQVMDLGYTFGQAAFCVVAVLGVARPGHSRAALPARATPLIPYAAIAVCFGLTVWQALQPGGLAGAHNLLRLLGDLVGTAAVTLIVVLRQNLAFRENADLTLELSQSAQELERRATHDSLTGLPNRALLEQRLEQATRQAHAAGRQVAVLYIDLDRFKTINDGLGHEVGDQLLIGTARALLAELGPHGTLARQGGDEFMVLLPDLAGPEQAEQLAGRLLRRLAAPLPVAGHQLVVTASLGLAVFPRDGHDGPTLRRHADAAMYRAKAAGRGVLRRYTPDMEGGLGALELEQALRGAMARGEFELHYQPQVRRGGPAPDPHAGASLEGMEVLLRWRRAGVLVPPAQFIGLAEDTGLIVPLGTWVLQQALRQLAAWDAAGVAVPRLAVNVSARQFGRPGLQQAVQAALAASGIAPPRLELELTESLVVQDLTGTTGQLAELRALGVRVAVDDFGTGHSSLSLLRVVPADLLKIDRSFVRGLPGDTGSAALVRMVLALARTLDLEVIAEGVETPEQWALLGGLGCALGQGFAFGHAMPADEVPGWLRRRAAGPWTGTGDPAGLRREAR